ncbi:MAG: hypothetical protein ABL958_15815, partial [Bdellovibrionia bacterium]
MIGRTARVLTAGCLVLCFGTVAEAALPIHATADVPILILPRETAPEIFNLDKMEMIVPMAVKPKDIDKTGEYEAVEALKQDGKPLTLWFKKNAAKYRSLRLEDIHVEVMPKWKTNEATIFTLPGKSHLDCMGTQKNKPCIAWPARRTVLKFLNAKLVESVDPADQLLKWRLFYQVQYKYTNKLSKVIQGTGWIFADDVVIEERRAPTTPTPTPLPPAVPPVAPGEPVTPPTPPDEPKTELETLTEKLAPHIGDCLVTAKKPLKVSTWNTLVSPAYTETLLPYWKKRAETKPPTVPDVSYKGKKITPAQLIAIDTMARSIYGEMATCNFSTGPVYLMAVAKVILNRADEANNCLGRRSLFMCVKPEMSACKKLDQPNFINDLTQVMVKPYQFSIWNNNRRIDLKRVLCPPGRQKEDRQKTGTISNYEKFDVDNWQDSVKIAMEAILEEEQFKKVTSEVT